jgi:hypothetical protein
LGSTMRIVALALLHVTWLAQSGIILHCMHFKRLFSRCETVWWKWSGAVKRH